MAKDRWSYWYECSAPKVGSLFYANYLLYLSTFHYNILFGKNLMTLSLPELKNSSKPINEDDLQKIIWNLSIRFG
jgi:hypothetical protein